MRWILLMLVPLAAVIVVALQVTQQSVLWNATEPGMTVDEARKALPKAIAPASAKRLANGLELKLTAEGVENLERAFDAELYFDANGLQQVVLLPTRPLFAGAAAAEFESLRQAATMRYGREQPATAPAPAGTRHARWVAGRVVVTLRMEADGDIGRVTMTYATTDVAGAS